MPALANIRTRITSMWLGAASSERWIVAILAGVAVLAIGFLGLAEAVGAGDTQKFDHAVLLVFRAPGHPSELLGPPWLHEAARDLTSLGSFSILAIVFVLVLGFLLIERRWRAAAWIAIAVPGGATISTLLKYHYDRPRPPLASIEVFTPSFPSGHAMVSAVVFLTLGAMLARASSGRGLKIYYFVVAAALTLLVGLSRLYLGVHYPSDVLAGWAAGAGWSGLCVIVSLLPGPLAFERGRRGAE